VSATVLLESEQDILCRAMPVGGSIDYVADELVFGIDSIGLNAKKQPQNTVNIVRNFLIALKTIRISYVIRRLVSIRIETHTIV
jgi:hypothetical protein